MSSQRDFRALAAKCLHTYRARGQTALDCLRSGDWQGADQALLSQRAAFHNFRAADDMARRDGHDVGSDPVLAGIWQDASIVEREIQQEFAIRGPEVLREIQEVQTTRRTLDRFRVRDSHQSRVSSPV